MLRSVVSSLRLFPVLLLTLGCQKPQFDTPEQAYSSFALLLQRGDLQGAYDALSKGSKDLIEARARALSEASGGAVHDEPATLAFATGVKPLPLTEVKLVRQEGDQAVVAVTSGGQTREQSLVREQHRWCVDLSQILPK